MSRRQPDTEQAREARLDGDEAPPTEEVGVAASGREELHEPPPPPDHAPLAEQAPIPPARIDPVVVPRWIQLVALPLGLFVLWALARAAGPVLLLFIVAAVIALILNPLVTLLQRGLPRGLAVAVVFVGFVAALVGFGILVAPLVSDQVSAFRDDVPDIVDSANDSLASAQTWLDDQGVDFQVKEPGSSALETLQNRIVRGSGDVVDFSRGLVEKVITSAFALVLIVVLTIYMLLYGPRIGTLVRAVMPPGDGTPDDDYPTRVSKAVYGYVRGQLLFSLLMGLGAGVSLWIFGALGIFPEGRTYAFFFGAWFALMELIPYIGPVLGALPPVVVALFQDPLTGLWVALLFVALQQIEGHIVAPLVFGHSLRINPLLVIFSLLMGAQLYGIVGALVSLPIAAIVRETTIYLRRHLVLEPWDTPSPAAVLAGRSARVRRCPECDAETRRGDAFCRSCGAPLGPRVGASP